MNGVSSDASLHFIIEVKTFQLYFGLSEFRLQLAHGINWLQKQEKPS